MVGRSPCPIVVQGYYLRRFAEGAAIAEHTDEKPVVGTILVFRRIWVLQLRGAPDKGRGMVSSIGFIEYHLCKLFPKMPSWLPIAVLFIISACCYETCYQPKYFDWAFGWPKAPNEFMNYTSFNQLFMYMIFFLYGNIVRRYWDQAQRVMDSKWFYPIIIVLVIFAALDSLRWHTMRMTRAIIPLTLARLLLLTIVFMYFRHYHQYFTQRTVVGRSLQYIGRRTLDIYLIHYLFLPDLPTMGSFFSQYRHNFVLDTTLSVVLALMVIGFSCITSNILRVSPFFKKWLFGRG